MLFSRWSTFVCLLSLLDYSMAKADTYFHLLDNTAEDLPNYYHDIIDIVESQLMIKPIKTGKLLWLVRPTSEDAIEFEIKQDLECHSTIHFYFYLRHGGLAQIVLPFLSPNSIDFPGEAFVHPLGQKVHFSVKKDGFEVKADATIRQFPRDRDHHFDIDGDQIPDYHLAQFYVYADNKCDTIFILPDSYHLALPFMNASEPNISTETLTTSTMTTKTTSTKATTTTTAAADAGFAIHWYIVILIVEIIVCMLIGGLSTWLYLRITKKFQPQTLNSSVSADSQDEEIETAIEGFQAATKTEDAPTVSVSKSVVTPPTVKTAPVGNAGITTARQAVNHHSHERTGTARTMDRTDTARMPGSKTPKAQKSKKSLFERMGDKLKRKNKESNSKKYFFKQPQVSVSGFSTSTTMNVPFAESKEQARGKAHPPILKEKKKKSMRKIKAQAPLSKEYGVDQLGCEPTQASHEEDYQSAIKDLGQARKQAQMYARLFTPDGKLRDAKELAEYDAQKAAAASNSKKR